MHSLTGASSIVRSHDDLTVVIPTCDRPEWAKALVAVVADVRISDDIIVIDDGAGSADWEHDVAGARISFTHGQGVAVARNKGLELARSTYVLFIDDDVVPSRQTLLMLAKIADMGEHDVVTVNVVGHNGLCAISALIDQRYPLSRGPEVRVFPGSTGAWWSPNDVWRVGVGACMLWRTELLRSLKGFEPRLGQGRQFGGSEDLYAFRRALMANAQIVYRGDLTVEHRHPSSWSTLREKMRKYAEAEGALAAHVLLEEKRLGMTLHVLSDTLFSIPAALEEAYRCVRGKAHLPFLDVLLFGVRAGRGFYGYLQAAIWQERPNPIASRR